MHLLDRRAERGRGTKCDQPGTLAGYPGRRHWLARMAMVIVALAALPALASAQAAQASIAGVVRDTSGAVLPGVTVEAASPALIEKIRTVVTDGAGQYRIESLRPGAYTVTFSLTGFNTVRREGIELAGSFAATISPEMRVGAVEETVTVTGESPIVDVQSATKQRVIGEEVLQSIPTGRTQFTAATLIPGMNLNNQDVGGTNIINTTGGSMTIHGSNGNDQRVMIDGLSTANSELAGQASNFLPNMGAVQEMAVDFSSGTADQSTSGVRINIIPREGGNLLRGTLFATGANSGFQASNYTTELRDRGLRTPNSVKMNYDVNPGVGGPLRKDALWFYASARWTKTQNYVGGMFDNKNAGLENVWTYDPDLSRPSFANAFQRSVNARLTWQANQKNKFGFFMDDQGRCQCANVAATTAPEAAISIEYPIQRMASVSWTSPRTNRLLLEARAGFRGENYKYNGISADDPAKRLITVTEQASVNGAPAGLQYHGGGIGGQTATQPYQNTYGRNIDVLFSASYVTGTHASKFGISDTIVLRNESLDDNIYHVSYRFNNGIPNQITQRTTPYKKAQRQPAGIGLYAQDRWTLNRLTLNMGLRYDYLKITIPAQHLDPAPLVPRRNLDLPETDLTTWKDLTPRLGAAYDLSGNGKTALKISIGKYVIAQGVQGPYGDAISPVNRLANFVTRTWTDTTFPVGDPRRSNFVPDCDLTNPLANLECGNLSDTNFGSATPSTTIDPGVLNGWAVRPYNWEFSASVQRELVPRISVDAGYFRRWFGNFAVTDDRNLAPSDFAPFSTSAPADPRLPGGGGYAVDGFVDLNANRATTPPNNLFTLAREYGDQIQTWNGVDLTVNARLRRDLYVQGGVSTGRTLTDNCEILAALPESNPLGLPYCRQQTNFLTQVKFLGSYTVPRVDVQVSGAFQSIPGPAISANRVTLAAQTTLGRAFTNAANKTLNLVEPGTLYGDRLNQLDIRFGKLLRAGKTRTSLNLDLYNAFNVSTVLAENATYSGTAINQWRVPTTIVTARFAKISVQFDF
jgi:hypothetical protein